MSDLFGRKYELIIGELKVTALDTSFNIVKNLDRESNTAEFHVLNLSEKSRNTITKEAHPIVQFRVGYGSSTQMLYSGESISVVSTKAGLDWDTMVECGDGEVAYKEKRISKSYKKGTTVVNIVIDLINILGIKSGNLSLFTPKLNLLETGSILTNGTTLHGKASEELDGIFKSCSLLWSVQDGALQIHDATWTLPAIPLILINDLLLEYPEIGSDNTLKCRTLIDTRIVPGVTVSVANRIFRVESCTYNGDIASNEWYVSIEGRVLKGDYTRTN